MSSIVDALRLLHLQLYVQGLWMPACILYTLLTGTTDVAAGVQHITDKLEISFLRHQKCPELKPGCVYLCNHRSWADFFVDQTLCGGAAYLSRKMVIIATPVSALWAWLSNSTWFFTRKRGIDRAKFFKWIDENWETRPESGLVAYPEGTRNSGAEPLKLKTGVLHYAFSSSRPVQIVITTGKERAVNEKKFKLNYGVKCVVEVSEVIDPTKFETFDKFLEEIRDIFKKTWDIAYENESNEEQFNKLVKFSAPLIKGQGRVDVPAATKWRLQLVRTVLVALVAFILRKRIAAFFF